MCVCVCLCVCLSVCVCVCVCASRFSVYIINIIYWSNRIYIKFPHLAYRSTPIDKFSFWWGGSVGFWLEIHTQLYIYIYIYIYMHTHIQTIHTHPDIAIMVRVFANGLRDLGSIPSRVLPKTQKMVLDATLLNTQHYMVRIKGKVEQLREKNRAPPHTHLCVEAIEKGAFGSPSTTVDNFTTTLLYIYIY